MVYGPLWPVQRKTSPTPSISGGGHRDKLAPLPVTVGVGHRNHVHDEDARRRDIGRNTGTGMSIIGPKFVMLDTATIAQAAANPGDRWVKVLLAMLRSGHW